MSEYVDTDSCYPSNEKLKLNSKYGIQARDYFKVIDEFAKRLRESYNGDRRLWNQVAKICGLEEDNEDE